MTLLERLRVVAASLADFDHAPDNIEVDTRVVSALLAEAATTLADSERVRETLRRERNAAMNERDEARAEVATASAAYAADMARCLAGAREGVETVASEALQHYANAKKRMEAETTAAIDAVARERDAARADVARLLRLASGPHINDEGE